jgi:hypothetical protein
MTMDLLSRRQFEEAASGDDDAGIRAHIESSRNEIHTAMPGIIKSFDATTQTASVQPCIHRFFRGDGFKELPRLFDVPVVFPRGGGFVLTFPIAAGDECLLIFSERAIDNWHAKGGTQPPSEFRTHDLSDAFAQVGAASLGKVVANLATDGVELRSLDGTSVVKIDTSGNITATAQTGNIDVTATTGKVTLNVPGGSSGAVQAVTGVVTGIDSCPILGLPHGLLGCGSARVHAGKV